MFFRRVCERLLDGAPFQVYGTGDQSRSFTYVGDVVEATRAAMERAPGGATYNVGGGDEASMREAIALLEETSGRRLALEHVDAVKGDMARTSADISRIRGDAGWQPRTPLREGLAAMWSWAAARVAAA
jgi:nucleoside-diphosphate-sugar epimerase